ncbi:ABC transporter ATP-binding protein [Actinotalea subterranea]|uniref:ABC transporter ATP-binding protein n=1 Tax=Actinotalea subterranea TaxID=2607497 RepID=UPI0011EFE677|nr:ABC transporter ATP-binding protein [Actinotalea subterranea]
MPETRRPEPTRPHLPSSRPTPEAPDAPVISVRHVAKAYGAKQAVRDVSFEVRRGEIFGVLGPNGAGKTTTVEMISGLRTPDTGTVQVLGLDPQRDAVELHRRVGSQLQESELPPRIKVGEALALYASFYDRPADGRALAEQLGLTASWDTQFRALSGGQKQRLSIALALVGNPEIAVLDELTTGLDPQARRDTWQLIEAVRDSGVTIVLVTHFMDEAERLCDRIALIDDGVVVATDTPAGLAERVAGGPALRLRTSDDVDDAQVARLLRALDTVRSVAIENGELVIDGRRDVVVEVVLALAAQGITPYDVEVGRPSLEDAFVALTRTPTGAQTPAAGALFADVEA